MNKNTVTNACGNEIDYDAAVNLMDDELREELADLFSGDDCTDQQFFELYCSAHELKYGEEFEPNKLFGQW